MPIMPIFLSSNGNGNKCFPYFKRYFEKKQSSNFCGYEGGFAPNLESNDDAPELTGWKAIKE